MLRARGRWGGGRRAHTGWYLKGGPARCRLGTCPITARSDPVNPAPRPLSEALATHAHHREQTRPSRSRLQQREALTMRVARGPLARTQRGGSSRARAPPRRREQGLSHPVVSSATGCVRCRDAPVPQLRGRGTCGPVLLSVEFGLLMSTDPRGRPESRTLMAAQACPACGGRVGEGTGEGCMFCGMLYCRCTARSLAPVRLGRSQPHDRVHVHSQHCRRAHWVEAHSTVCSGAMRAHSESCVAWINDIYRYLRTQVAGPFSPLPLSLGTCRSRKGSMSDTEL